MARRVNGTVEGMEIMTLPVGETLNTGKFLLQIDTDFRLPSLHNHLCESRWEVH